MAIDWAEALEKQAALAREMSKNVLMALAKGDLTFVQVAEIDASVRRCAANFDRIATTLHLRGLDGPGSRKTEAIGGIWANLCRVTGDRLHLAQAANEPGAGPLRLDEQA
ncbi:MAG: hypothetical protein BGN87_17315 [Rhizobiales bacterium 65-79]|jgi:hypothetical protein|nr:hypothetical protein [Hyphomicrobiales bacterium]OJU06718.1 MAG: hypothetical protein BGN87_17315 [Rhizobiales bacterium 65-79]